MVLITYTKRQSWCDRAFSIGGSCCSAHCEACGRVYFVTSPGHGDYEEGELEELRENSEKYPGIYIEVWDFSYVSTMILPHNGKTVVIGCVCDPTEQLSDFIEDNARQLTEYLAEYWMAERRTAERKAREAAEALNALEDRTVSDEQSDQERN